MKETTLPNPELDRLTRFFRLSAKETQPIGNPVAASSHASTRNSLLLSKNWILYSMHFFRQDLRRQYDGTMLGVVWLLISQTITITGIGIVYTLVFKTDIRAFFPYLAISLLSWNLVSGMISESPRLYHSAGPILNSFAVPYATFALRMLLRYFVSFFFGLPVFIVVAVIFQARVFPEIFLVIPNLILLFLFIYPASNVLGILGARYRDLAPAVSSIVYLLFLVSPVIFRPSQIPEHGQLLVTMNPFYYLLDLVRSPFLGEVPRLSVYIVVIIAIILAWTASNVFNRRYGRYVVFWV